MFGFGFFDSVFPVLFTVMFVLVLGVIIVTLVRMSASGTKTTTPRA